MSSDPLQIVASTADPAFATDEKGRIVIWNHAAEDLFGRNADEVLGQPCHEVLRGRDVFGNCYCHEGCSPQRMVRQREAICSFEIDLEHADGDSVRVGISIVAVPGPRQSQYSLIHLLRPRARDVPQSDSGRGPLASFAAGTGAPAPQSPGSYSLTPREVEILQALAKGWTTHQIADRLYISVATVRNHVQNILQKLDVHSRVEAVSLALRERLI